MFILSKFIRNVLNQCLIIFFKTLTLQVRFFFLIYVKKIIDINKAFTSNVLEKKNNLFKKQKRHEKTCAVLRNKTCFYLQSRSGHSNC